MSFTSLHLFYLIHVLKCVGLIANPIWKHICHGIFSSEKIVCTLRNFEIKIKYQTCYKVQLNCFPSLKITRNSTPSLASHYFFLPPHIGLFYLCHFSLSYRFMFLSFPSSHTFQLNCNLLKVRICTQYIFLALLSTPYKVQGHCLCLVNVNWMSSVMESNKWIFFLNAPCLWKPTALTFCVMSSF